MRDYVRKAKIRGNVILTAAIVSVIAFFVGIFSYSRISDAAIALIYPGCLLAITFFMIYFVKYYWLGHTLRLLRKSGLEHCLDDIDLAEPTFAKSRIYCGKDAFFCKRTGSVVAYEQIAWIYSIGGALGEYTIRLKNGKKAYVKVEDTREMHSLINDHIAAKNPGVIEGDSVQSRSEYYARYPEAAAAVSKWKVIVGSVVIAYAALGITAGIANDSLDAGSLIVAGVIMTIGVVLLLFGLKGPAIVSWMADFRQRLANSRAFNNVCKAGSYFAMCCMVLLFASGILKIEFLFLPAVIGYGAGMVFLMGSLFLRTGLFNKETPGYKIVIPDEMLDDTSYITDIAVSKEGDKHIYAFRLTSPYGWDYITSSIDYLCSSDMKGGRITVSVGELNNFTDITKAYLKGRRKGSAAPEWTHERGCARLTGMSRALKCVVGIFYYNQMQVIRIVCPFDNRKAATAYAETVIRRSFGTPDQLKLARPIPVGEPVSVNDNQEIFINSRAFVKWLNSENRANQYEFNAAMLLNEKEPVISLYDDGVKTREYRLQTEGDEDFSGKYFHTSVRLSIQGNPPVPAMQIDGFISDTTEERGMQRGDVGYRMEGYFLRCAGRNAKLRYNMLRGQDLPMKALKYPGYTTPSNVRLIGICPECGKSFCFRGYAFYMGQSDVAYSDDGLDCCEIQAWDIDKDTWSYEADGKVFRYYNSFNCPCCGTPYIDYKQHPENKVYGVSGCVLIGRKHYTADR